MRRDSVLRILAGAFAALAMLYGAAAMYYARTLTTRDELGFDWTYSRTTQAALVTSVDADGPAAQAGIRTNDRITEANGRPLNRRQQFGEWNERPIPPEVVFTVIRPDGRIDRMTVRASETPPTSLTRVVEHSLLEILWFYPVVFLVVGLTVLMQRPSDRSAWIMAALFASLMAVPAFPRTDAGVPPALTTFVRWYKVVAVAAIPTFFFGFFATFPARAPLDRRVPWLKWMNILGWVLVVFPNVAAGGSRARDILGGWVGHPVISMALLGYLLGGVPLGIAALVSNVVAAPTSDDRRKARVLLWGTVVGIGPIIIVATVQLVFGVGLPAWLFSAALVMVSWFPLSFAYAVIKHRVIDVPVLLRRGARYVLVRRGFFVLLALLGMVATAAFTLSFTTLFEVDVALATAAGVAFGMVLTAGSAPLIRRATTRIDRAFFRSAYDASAILEGLAETISQVASRDELASLLEREITEALHPVGLIIYLEDADGQLHARAARWYRPTPPLPVDLPWLVELAAKGRPWDVSAASKEEPPSFLQESQAESLVPILGQGRRLLGARGRRLLGVIIVGASPSEQPYSGEDKRLLLSVAHQAGVALENIMLAENIAERLDVERATERELEIARQVQFRLFPQKQIPLATLEYAGGCIQARHVGGDYYDFIELGPGRLALVVADIAGKGIGAALLMANLQANLRAQYAIDRDDLPRLLTSVNKLFYDNTAESQYATLVLADYDASTRRLRYANCGHFPPILLHADGSSELLTSTATVLGLFVQWEVTTSERALQPGDLLVIYTDGMVEAMNRRDEDFGRERLRDLVTANRDVPVSDLVSLLHTAVQTFSEGTSLDDLTVVVGRVT